MAIDNVWVRADEHGSGLHAGWALHRADAIRSVELIGGMLSIRLAGESRHLKVGRRGFADSEEPDPAGQLVQLIAVAAKEPTPMVVEDRGGELWAGQAQDAIAHHADQEAKKAAELAAAAIDWSDVWGDRARPEP